MKSWHWGVLIFELFLFALILVLPQVDLPDFTVNGGTAPVVAKAKLSAAPVLCCVATAALSRLPQHVGEMWSQPVRPAVRLKPNALLSLLCILLC